MTNLDSRYGIDERVRAFEEHREGLLVSLAGPGTGKTRSLLRRIGALRSSGEPMESVCYLTFIGAIAEAFADDYDEYMESFGQDALEAARPRMLTLHSFACRLLRNHGYKIDYAGDLHFLNAVDERALETDIFLDDLVKITSEETLDTVPRMREGLKSIKTAWQRHEDPESLPEPLCHVASIASDLSRAYRALDWDFAVRLAGKLLRDGGDPAWIADIRHYLVDEYQDFNPVEQEFISLLAQRSTSMVVVGDDDQSLYKSRSGSPAGLRDLYGDPRHDSVSLTRNFRCRYAIVQAANAFQQSMSKHPRPMIASKDAGKVVCLRFKSRKAEVEYLVRALQGCLERTPEDAPAKLGTVCLFVSRKALNSYYDALSDAVPIARRSAPATEIRLWLSYVLRLIRHPEQRFLQRLLMERYTDLKPRHKKEVLQLLMDKDLDPCSACRVISDRGKVRGSAAAAAASYLAFCDAAKAGEVSVLASGIESLLGIPSSDLAEPLGRLVGARDEPDEERLISEACDDILPDSAPARESPKQVLFLTMHGSKGLTRRYVFMPGLEKAWLPGDATGDELLESRRLFYVALTRATDGVAITYPATRARGDPLNYDAAGRGEGCPFVTDAGLSFVCRN